MLPSEFITKGGESMDVILAILVSVEGGLLVELILKWLDGKDNRKR